MKNGSRTAIFFIISMLSVISIGCICGCERYGPEFAYKQNHYRPIIFIHGMAGSADQFELQALRMTSNGYPADFISGFEYSTDVMSIGNGFVAETLNLVGKLDAYVDTVRQRTGADQVDLVGHSLGTMVSASYLSDPNRALKVAHYVNIDSLPASVPPGGIPTLALWAENSATIEANFNREIVGAKNVTLSSVTHVQAASCIETFIEMYMFLNGEAPQTGMVLPESSGTITLSGKVLTVMRNTAPAGAFLSIYSVDDATGKRISDVPDYQSQIDTSGAFAFKSAYAGIHYEFCLVSENTLTQHFYYEPFIRSDYLIRIKASPPETTMANVVVASEKQTNLIILRNKEFVGDYVRYPNDSLTVNGREMCTAEMFPVINGIVCFYVYDAGADEISHFEHSIAAFNFMPYTSGADYFLPSHPPSKSISVVLNSRGTGEPRALNVPNWKSTGHKVSLQFFSY